MGIIDRITRIGRANINGLLDEAENPEVMIDQILRDMQQGISEAKQQIAGLIAEEKELSRDAAENLKLSEAFGAHAERAVAAGEDDLAREALRRQRDYASNAEVYAQQVTSQQAVISRMKTQLATLESKFRATAANRDSLLARHRSAKAEQSVFDSTSMLSPYDPTSDLNRIERKIRSAESSTAATIEMRSDRFLERIDELDVDEQIETALIALKATAPMALGDSSSAAVGEDDAARS